MMNTKLSNVIKTTKGFMVKHSPEILTGVGVAGMITTTIMAVGATPKALYLIEMEKASRMADQTETLYADNTPYVIVEEPKLKPLEIVKVAWKPYIPALSLGLVSTACIIGASAVNYKRNAALATAYAISERTLVKYRDKVIETIGEKKERDVREKIAQDSVNEHPVVNTQVIIASGGDTLFKDSISERYFKSDVETIKKAVNKLNRDMNYQNYVSLDDLYSELGLSSTKISSYMGWNLDDGHIEIDFIPAMAENDKPCLVLDYMVAPRYEFDKLM